VVNCLDEADQLAFVSRKLGVAQGDWLAKERHWAAALMQHRTEARAQCVAFDDEVMAEGRQL